MSAADDGVAAYTNYDGHMACGLCHYKVEPEPTYAEHVKKHHGPTYEVCGYCECAFEWRRIGPHISIEHGHKAADVMIAKDSPVYDDPDQGRLRCEVHAGTYWCEHMVKWVGSVANLDAAQIDMIDDPEPVTVPIMPSKDVWAICQVVGLHIGGMHEVFVTLKHQPIKGTGRFEPKKDLHSIGVLAPGEGRYAIRLILFEWLKHKWVTGPECSAPTHNFAVKPRWPVVPRMTDPTNDQLVDLWFMLTEGACSSCAGFLDISDDVPEV